MKPEVSVVSSVFRPGGIDILLQGMHDQTFKNFEVILVDNRYEKRHKKVMEFAKAYGVNLIHVPEHRRNGKWSVLAAGWNTAFMLAEAPIIVMLIDYAYAPPRWLERHLVIHNEDSKQKRLVMAPHVHLALPPIRVNKAIPDVQAWMNKQMQKRYCCLTQEKWEDYFDEISIFQSLFEVEWLERLSISQPPDQDPKLYQLQPLDYKWFHMKNESFRRKSVYDINGVDETFDNDKGPMDTELGYRFLKYGCQFVFDRLNPVFVLNPRSIMGAQPWGDMDVRLEGRWSFNNDGILYQNKRIEEMEQGAPAVAQNPYKMATKRREILHWKNLNSVPTGNLESA